ncbi:bifunctional glycosyltransferase family 2 protein/CDP-glycerol:glycerophosphate glycerophosphotransferase [Streptomyces sp. NPDC046939]|uniref:bifunctional glycosyltransferase family 2 protein/CDP-glycerol:glycerophosphate glycerophosphotransferase n=1 Tax=Streptomyces sp. NPDC046939 TaxID=3155376 RepID=UPI00340ACF5E
MIEQANATGGFSVVVTAVDAQGFLRACLDSALNGSPGVGAVEVVVVDNGSTDLTGAILDEYVERDERVRAVRLPHRRPAGAARAVGALLTGGAYLLFIEGHDTLAPDALTVLARRAEETGNPDVIAFDHADVAWNQRITAGKDERLLCTPDRAAFALADRPRTLHLTPTLANRALRADFYAAHRELFGQDACTEVLPALGSLLAAERIAVTDAVLLTRTRHEPPPVADTYFNLFPQYEEVWRLLASGPPRTEEARIVFSGMVRRYLKVLALPGTPAAEQAAFLRRAGAHFARYKPAGYQRPAGLNGVRHALLERGSYAGYRASQVANRRRRDVRTLAATAKRKGAEAAREGLYREQLHRPLDEHLAVFSAYWDRGVLCSPAAISARLGELAPSIRQVWVVRREHMPLVPPGTDCVAPGSRRWASVLARAKYLVNNVNYPDSVVKRPGQIHLQTHHGTPLKRMGVDQAPFPATSRGVDYEALLQRCARWDYSVSANRHSTEVWTRAYPVPFTSLDYGYPRNDLYYTAGAEDVLRVRERLGIAPGRKALLYAPTHRDYESAWTPRLDLRRLAGALGEEFLLLVRGHYFYDRGPSPLTELHREGRIVDVSRYDSVEELGLASDALITDYSSVMFDFANLDRPIVLHVDDWETYAVTRGVYFDLPREAPGAVASSQDAIERLFEDGSWNGAEAALRRAAFRRRFCEFDDGHAAERVVRHVFLGQPGVPPITPLDRRTPAPDPERAAALVHSSPPEDPCPGLPPTSPSS